MLATFTQLTELQAYMQECFIPKGCICYLSYMAIALISEAAVVPCPLSI